MLAPPWSLQRSQSCQRIWLIFADCADVNQYWNKFLEVVYIAVDIFVPTKSPTPHNTQRKYPKHIRKLLSKKKACWARLKKFNTTALLNSYKTCSAKCSQAIYEFFY